MRGTGGVIKDVRYVVHVLLINSFLAQRGHFFSWEPLDQLEISALTECELKRFSWAFRAGASSPLACLPLGHPFSLAPTNCKCLLGERRSAEREVAGSNPGRSNTQGLKIIKKKVLLDLQTVRLSSLLG